MRRKVKRLVKGLLKPLRVTITERPAVPEPTRTVWRMTEHNPKGEWVEPRAADTMPAALHVESIDSDHSSGWLTSSMDLMSGAEVSEYPHPGDADIEGAPASDRPLAAAPPKWPHGNGNGDA